MLIDIWSRREKWVWRIIIISWVLFLAVFYYWWFLPEHVGTSTGFLLTTLVVSWPILLFAYSFFFLLKMKKPDSSIPVPSGLRVAMVVTKTPQEPSRIVRETLLGALEQKYPHDTWIADEDPSLEDLNWYKEHGVKVSCRKDNSEYHRNSWPRRKRSKEGNLAYFYDHYGYKMYDIVVHLDADHTPSSGYLEHMLRPFIDSNVGYVAAPSVCDSNAESSWSARARMHVEAIFHGPIQSGTNSGWVPICIGSHYAARTEAIKNIGGIGPELAEDYSTTLLLNAAGWKGVWVYDAKARGEGPHSFADIIIQDYQWSRSLVVILLTIFPKLWRKLNIRQLIYFAFTQLWYPVSALVWATSIYLVSSALITGVPPVVIKFSSFVFLFLPSLIMVFITLYFIRKKQMLRPEYGSVISFENVLFEFARWPWVLVSSIEATVSTLISRWHNYRVTPKGGASSMKMSFHLLLPYIVVALILMFALVFGRHNPAVFGYYIFAIVIAGMYIALCFLVVILHFKETKEKTGASSVDQIKDHSPHLVSFFAISTIFVLIITLTGSRFVNYLKIEKENEYKVVQADALVEQAQSVVLREYLNKLEGNIAVENNTEVSGNISAVTATSGARYVVVDGDNLWNIAKKHYGSGKLWYSLISIDPEKLADPDFILPGYVFLLPDVETQI